jgi:hypothetical protein
MKIGAENKKKAIAAGALLLVAISVFYWEMEPSGGSSSAPAATTSKTAAVSEATSGRSVAPVRSADRDRGPRILLPPSLDPRLRLDLLKYSEDVNYAGNGVNIFQVHEDPQELEKIENARGPGLLDKPGAATPPAQPPGPPQPAPPPPINLRFYGWASKPGEPLAVFLSQGEQVFIAREGQIVASRYKVVKITRTQVDIEDVLSNNKQSIKLNEG